MQTSDCKPKSLQNCLFLNPHDTDDDHGTDTRKPHLSLASIGISQRPWFSRRDKRRTNMYEKKMPLGLCKNEKKWGRDRGTKEETPLLVDSLENEIELADSQKLGRWDQLHLPRKLAEHAASPGRIYPAMIPHCYCRRCCRRWYQLYRPSTHSTGSGRRLAWHRSCCGCPNRELCSFRPRGACWW